MPCTGCRQNSAFAALLRAFFLHRQPVALWLITLLSLSLSQGHTACASSWPVTQALTGFCSGALLKWCFTPPHKPQYSDFKFCLSHPPTLIHETWLLSEDCREKKTTNTPGLMFHIFLLSPNVVMEWQITPFPSFPVSKALNCLTFTNVTAKSILQTGSTRERNYDQSQELHWTLPTRKSLTLSGLGLDKCFDESVRGLSVEGESISKWL